jgi:hypothetical protein
MSKAPKYPVGDDTSEPVRPGNEAQPPDDFLPSFKFRHEVRPAIGSAQDAFARAYPQPRRLSSRAARLRAIREGS